LASVRDSLVDKFGNVIYILRLITKGGTHGRCE
jgi:hypothetical protein